MVKRLEFVLFLQLLQWRNLHVLDFLISKYSSLTSWIHIKWSQLCHCLRVLGQRLSLRRGHHLVGITLVHARVVLELGPAKVGRDAHVFSLLLGQVLVTLSLSQDLNTTSATGTFTRSSTLLVPSIFLLGLHKWAPWIAVVIGRMVVSAVNASFILMLVVRGGIRVHWAAVDH